MARPITVTVPAKVDYVHVVRSVVASVAARLDFTFDDIEDLCLAVDEACGALLESSAPLRVLRASFVDGPDGALEAEVEGDGLPGEWPPAGLQESLTWQILHALAEEVRFEEVSGRAVVRLSKGAGR